MTQINQKTILEECRNANPKYLYKLVRLFYKHHKQLNFSQRLFTFCMIDLCKLLPQPNNVKAYLTLQLFLKTLFQIQKQQFKPLISKNISIICNYFDFFKKKLRIKIINFCLSLFSQSYILQCYIIMQKILKFESKCNIIKILKNLHHSIVFSLQESQHNNYILKVNLIKVLVQKHPINGYHFVFTQLRQISNNLGKLYSLQKQQKQQYIQRFYKKNKFSFILSLVQFGSSFSQLINPLILVAIQYIKCYTVLFYLPLHIQILKLLIRLSNQNNILIPQIIPIIITLFNYQYFRINHSPSTQQFKPNLHLSKTALNSYQCHQYLYQKMLSLLNDALSFPYHSNYYGMILKKIKKFKIFKEFKPIIQKLNNFINKIHHQQLIEKPTSSQQIRLFNLKIHHLNPFKKQILQSQKKPKQPTTTKIQQQSFQITQQQQSGMSSGIQQQLQSLEGDPNQEQAQQLINEWQRRCRQSQVIYNNEV